MWPCCSHILAPLTSLLKVKEFQWGPKQQKAFNKMKALMATYAVLVHPDHNFGFNVEANASDCQLGAIIEQNGRLVVHHSWKLSAAQKNCTTIGKELLSVAEMLHTFPLMSLGAKIAVHMDHKTSPTSCPNLPHSVSCAGVCSWRNLDPHLHTKRR